MREWSKYQKAVFEAVRETNDSLLIEAVAGSGKCLGRGTPVLRANGKVSPVEDIALGDLLMGPDSKPRRVCSLARGRDIMYRITPTKGESWVCNQAHILVLEGTNRFKGKRVEVSVSEYLKSCSEQKSFKCQWKLVRGKVDWEEYTNQIPFEPYLMGLWLGDGTTSEVGFTTTDYKIISYLAEAAPRYGAEAVLSRDGDCIKVRYRVGHRGEAGPHTPFPLRRALLKEFQVEGQKLIPHHYLTANHQHRLELLAGLLDTDGSLSGNCYDFVSKFPILAQQVVFLARSLGFAAYIKPKLIDGTIYWRLSISGELSEIPCILPHKKATIRQQIKRVEVTGFELKRLGEGDYYGFTLDGDGQFLLGDFTITHNTTTIVEAINHVPQNKSIAFLAFNKSIAQELGRRITAPNARCMTLHSAGFTAWKRFVGSDVQVDSRKTFELIKTSLSWPERQRNGQLNKLIGLAKQIGMVPGDELEVRGSFVDDSSVEGLLPGCHEGALCKGLVEDDLAVWRGLLEEYAIDEDEVDIAVARRVLRASIEQAREVVDFDDMLFMPVISSASFEKFDVVFVDEAQDLSGIQRVMIQRMLRPGARVIAVGDRHQAIYAFRGASSDAMPLLREEFGCKPLPLSISYRCPKSVVKKAQQWVEHIEFSETAPEGLVVEYPEKWDLRAFLPTDSILCRLTRPLVEVAFLLIRNKIPCRILGRDIGAGLVALVKKSKLPLGGSLEAFECWLDSYHSQERRKLLDREETAKAGLLNDKVMTLMVFVDDLGPESTIGELQQEIEQLFSDNDSGKLTLSTVHKSKGLEYPRVFILDAHELMPCPWATRPGDAQQERNLQYVACTRAQEELYYITSAQLGGRDAR